MGKATKSQDAALKAKTVFEAAKEELPACQWTSKERVKVIMVAHITIVCCRYIMLAVEKRNHEDNRTIGRLFYFCCDEVQDFMFIESLLLLIEILTEGLRRLLDLSENKIQEIISKFIAALSLSVKGKLKVSMCES